MTSQKSENTSTITSTKILFSDDEKKQVTLITGDLIQTFKHKKNCIEKVKKIFSLEQKDALKLVNDKLGIVKKSKEKKVSTPILKPKRLIENTEITAPLVIENTTVIDMLQTMIDKQDTLQEKVEELSLKQTQHSSMFKKIENIGKQLHNIDNLCLK